MSPSPPSPSPAAAATLKRLAAGDVPWGSETTETMLVSSWTRGGGWKAPAFRPVASGLNLSPAASVLHYGCSVFEGMKVFAAPSSPSGGAVPPGGAAALFRPDYHAARLNASAARVALPAVDAAQLVEDVKDLVRRERDAGWLPAGRGAALYVRPVLFASEGVIGVRRSDEATLVVTCHPVAAYFGGGEVKSLRLCVDPKGRVRAWPGGCGEAKSAGNYAGSIGPAEEAAEQGFDQVLWTGGGEERLVGEVGQMNFFWVEKGDGRKVLVTPELDGTILPGATRASILEMAEDCGFKAEERRVPLAEFVRGVKEGRIMEMFGTGTGAIVVPVKSVYVDGEDLVVKEKEEAGDASVVLRETLLAIYHQENASAWMEPVDAKTENGGGDVVVKAG